MIYSDHPVISVVFPVVPVPYIGYFHRLDWLSYLLHVQGSIVAGYGPMSLSVTETSTRATMFPNF